MIKLATLKPTIKRFEIGSIRAITTQTQRITGRRLQAIRKAWLTTHPLCAECERHGRVSDATEVDHVIALHRGGHDDDSNRQSLCELCHKAKTAEEARGRAGQMSGAF